MGDVSRGVRTIDVLERSLPRLNLYGALDAQLIDVTHLTARETALKIARRISSAT